MKSSLPGGQKIIWKHFSFISLLLIFSWVSENPHFFILKKTQVCYSSTPNCYCMSIDSFRKQQTVALNSITQTQTIKKLDETLVPGYFHNDTIVKQLVTTCISQFSFYFWGDSIFWDPFNRVL